MKGGGGECEGLEAHKHTPATAGKGRGETGRARYWSERMRDRHIDGHSERQTNSSLPCQRYKSRLVPVAGHRPPLHLLKNLKRNFHAAMSGCLVRWSHRGWGSYLRSLPVTVRAHAGSRTYLRVESSKPIPRQFFVTTRQPYLMDTWAARCRM